MGCTYNTILSWNIQKQTKEFNELTLILKAILNIAMLLLFYLNTFGSTGGIESEDGSNLGVYIEWTAAYCQCMYFYLMAKDVEGFNFEY